jgi:hypothetical protein
MGRRVPWDQIPDVAMELIQVQGDKRYWMLIYEDGGHLTNWEEIIEDP